MIRALTRRGSGMVSGRPHRYHGRNSMLENQLFLIVGFEHERILIEALDTAGEFHAAQEIDSNHTFFFARIVQKTILYVLRWFIHICTAREIVP